jgi:hypothetical protein
VQLETDLTQSDIKEQLIRPASDATQRGVHGGAEATKASRSSATVRRTVARTTPPSNSGDQNLAIAFVKRGTGSHVRFSELAGGWPLR